MPVKHQLRRLALVGASGGILLSAVVGFGGRAVAATNAGVSAARVGTGTLTPIGTVTLSSLPSTVPGSTTSPSASVGPLERDGKPLSLPSRASAASKPAAVASSSRVNAAGGVAVAGPQCSTACTVHQNFDGINLATSNCGCLPPDVNAAISPLNDVESVNLDLAVYSLSGTLVKSTSLKSFFKTTLSLSDPRVLYDNTWQRFVLSLTVVPATTTSTPFMFIAASQTNKATGKWNLYRLSFGGGSFPAGALLDQPQLGMDQDSVIVGTNNYQKTSTGYSYVASVVFAMAKQRLYTAQGIGFPAFGVAFSTSPAMMAGLPQQQAGKEFMLAADTTSGGRLDIYYMTNSSRPDSTAVTLEATPAMTYSPPSRRVNQPGTTNTLDSSDGRIVWAPMENAESGSTTVWFAHGIDIGGFPGIQYGVATVNLGGSDAVAVADAYHSGTSDDFNPSIAVNPDPGNCPSCAQVWVNWAYDDAPQNVATSDTVNNVASGGGVPSLTSGDTTLINGSITTTEGRFGDYSSTAINPAAVGTCGAGQTALVANQYFASDGTWHTRMGEVGFC